MFKEILDTERLWARTDKGGRLSKRNTDEDTCLHVAAKSGTIKGIVDALFPQAILQDGISHPRQVWRFDPCPLQNAEYQTALAVTMNSDLKEEDVIHIMKTFQHSKELKEMFWALCRFVDVHFDTLLHTAVKRRRFKTIQYLADKPVNEKQLNKHGFSPLHMAVVLNDVELLRHLISVFKFKLNINEPTASGETVLHIATKKGLLDMLQEIVKSGGDLSQQDNDGNTPLHDCLQQVYMESGATNPDFCEKFRRVWKKVVQLSVLWRCQTLQAPVPDVGSHRYKKIRRDAMFYLRSGICNQQGDTVLQYADNFGLTQCVMVMLTEEDVFVKKSYEDSPVEYEIEITNLSPEYTVDVNFDATEEVRGERNKRPGSTLLQTLADVNPPCKATEVLTEVPVKHIAAWQWFVYQFFSVAWLLFHIVVMTVQSLNALQEINPTTDSNSATAYQPSFNPNENGTEFPQIAHAAPSANKVKLQHEGFDIFVLIYSTILYIFIGTNIVKLLLILFAQFCLDCLHKKQDREMLDESDKLEDRGILSYLTVIVRYIVSYSPALQASLFTVLSYVLYFSMRSESMTQVGYAWIKGTVLLTGWLLLFIPARTYGPIYSFIATLKYIVIRDMIPFILFYMVITVAFACALSLQFQVLSPDSDNEGLPTLLDSLNSVINELIILTTGMDTDLKHVQDVSGLFDGTLTKAVVGILLVLYGLISVVILLNMLIALMGSTLSTVVTEEGLGWKQYQVVSFFLSRVFSE